MGIEYIPTESNAILINFREQISEIKKLCIKYGVKFRDEIKCGIPNHIQVHLIDLETVMPFHKVLLRMNNE